MTRRIAWTIVILLFCPPVLLAQEGPGSFTVYASYFLPLEEYGETIGYNAGVTRRFGFNIGDKAGLSDPGFGLGIEFRTPVLMRGLEWVISLQGMTNGINTTDVTGFFENELDDTVAVILTTGSWYHIPLFTGLMYSLDIAEWFRIGTTLQGGVYVSQQAPRSVEANGVLVEKTTFRFMPDFGYLAGISLTLFGDYQLLVRYCNLGTPRYEGTRYLSEAFFTTIPRRENAISGDARPVAMVVFSIGYTL